ncbi:hypothetical protein Tco_0577508 [Tanacetum coccineum]
MFQQHHDESLSEAWTHFKDLLHKVPHHGIDIWLQIQIFYDHVSFPLNREIDHATGGRLCDKITKESWEIIENLALHDHESWNDLRDFAKPVKASTLPQDVPITSDRQLFELEDQISYLLKGSKTTPKTSLTQPPKAYANMVSSNQHTQGFTEPPKQSSFTFQKRVYPKLQ